MRKIPGSSNFIFELIIHLESISFRDDVRHKTAVVRRISVIGPQMPFQASQTPVYLCVIVRELNFLTLKREGIS